MPSRHFFLFQWINCPPKNCRTRKLFSQDEKWSVFSIWFFWKRQWNLTSRGLKHPGCMWPARYVCVARDINKITQIIAETTYSFCNITLPLATYCGPQRHFFFLMQPASLFCKNLAHVWSWVWRLLLYLRMDTLKS